MSNNSKVIDKRYNFKIIILKIENKLNFMCPSFYGIIKHVI